MLFTWTMLICMLTGSQLVPLVQQQAKVNREILDSVLKSWNDRATKLRNAHYEIEITSKGASEKNQPWLMKVDVKFLDEGQCWFKMIVENKKHEIESTYIIRGKDSFNFDAKTKTVYQTIDKRVFTREGLLNYSNHFFAVLPLIATSKELQRLSRISVVQSDDHYHWLRFEPATTDTYSWTVAQVGVIKYQNTVSPKDFPVRIMWREPGGGLQTWTICKLIVNDIALVNDELFQEDIKLQRLCWKVQKTFWTALQEKWREKLFPSLK
jgi:hypothetical protein